MVDAVQESKTTPRLLSTFSTLGKQFLLVFENNVEEWISDGFAKLMWTLRDHKYYKESHTYGEFVNLIFQLEGNYHSSFPASENEKDWYSREIKAGLPFILSNVDNKLHNKIRGLLTTSYRVSFKEAIANSISLLPEDIQKLLFLDKRKYINYIRDIRVNYAHGKDSNKMGDELSYNYHRTVMLIWMIVLQDIGFSEKTQVTILEGALKYHRIGDAV